MAANRAVASIYERVSELMLRSGNAALDRGRVLITERLHGHVLAILRHQPTILLPDAFGKNRAIYESFTSRFDNVTWAESPAEAADLVATGRV